MRKILAALVAVTLCVIPAHADPPVREDLAALVDPMIGTLGAGFTFPGPAAPFGMVQVSPDTDGIFAYTGYQWMDHEIRGFSMVHTESMGVPEGGNVPFMPTTGAISTDVLQYQTPFSHAQEHAEAGYYSVSLPQTGINVELAAGVRAGMQRYTFPAGATGNVIIDAGRQIDGGRMIPSSVDPSDYQSIPGTNHASIHEIDDQTIGGATNLDHNVANNYGVFFVAHFDRPFANAGGWDRGGPGESAPTHALPVNGQGAGAYATFDTSSERTVTVKVGISFVSEANALQNLDSEIGSTSFEELVRRTRSQWNDTLSTIKVQGGSHDQQVSFYTALYHAQHHPNVFNDSNGEYLGHDLQVHTIGAPGDPIPAGSSYYTNFSLWDTYRGEMQLLALIQPTRFEDMMRSLTAMAEQGGRLPRWAHMNYSPDYMVGEPALNVAAFAYCSGLVPDDIKVPLYNAMHYAMFDAPRDPIRFSLGYVPNNPSATLEHSLAAFSMAEVADLLGNTTDRDNALARASDWKNTFDYAQSHFFRPRNADGTFVSPFIPESQDGFDEGTAWQYLWLVPHDVHALFDSIGADTAKQRLDEFFTWPLAPSELQQKLSLYGIAYYGNQYTPANETDLQAPYLYDFIGAPWKTQAIARQYQSLYRTTPDGVPGNDDLGELDAWHVWSDLGFYPAIGGASIYTIGSPLFPHVTITSSRAVTEINADSEAPYIQSVSSENQGAITKPWFSGSEFAHNDTLSFSMGPVPNMSWGSAPTDAPPSLSLGGLPSFECAAS
ncbi:MAG: GH92 family glycosyl hydrolase [Actinomycetota bacterium]